MSEQYGIVLVGGGGHCRSVIDVLECAKLLVAGIIHGPHCALEPVLGYPVLGRDASLEQVRTCYTHALVTVGHIKNSYIRQDLFTQLQCLNFVLPVCVSPLAYVSSHACLGMGSVVLHHALVNAGVQIGSNCIINSKALVEHDCTIADHCHISVGATLCGNVHLQEGVFVGAGSVVRQGVTIGKHAVIGCGTLVLSDIAAYTVHTMKISSLSSKSNA